QHIARQSDFACHAGLVLDFGAESGRDAVRAVIRSIVSDRKPDRPTGGIGADGIAMLVGAGKVSADRAIFLHDLLNIAPPVELRALHDAMDAGMHSRGIITTITEIIASAARDTPLLIVLEDLHWSDDSLLAQISAVAETASNVPLLLVLTSRHDG